MYTWTLCFHCNIVRLCVCHFHNIKGYLTWLDSSLANYVSSCNKAQRRTQHNEKLSVRLTLISVLCESVDNLRSIFLRQFCWCGTVADKYTVLPGASAHGEYVVLQSAVAVATAPTVHTSYYHFCHHCGCRHHTSFHANLIQCYLSRFSTFSWVSTEMDDQGYTILVFNQATQANSVWPSLCG